MDKIKLRKFVNVLVEYSELINDKSPLIIRRTNSFNGLATVFVLSPTRPDDVLMPINSYWVNTDNEHPDYKKMYFRTAIGMWQELSTSPEDSWHVVEYAEQDSLSTNLEVADSDTLGTVTLSAEPVDGQDPVVLTEGDISLTNARNPLPHDELHPEIPASQIKTQAGAVNINRSLFGQYKYLTSVNNMDAYWSFFQVPVPGVSVLPDPTPYNRDTVTDVTGLDDADVTNVEVYLV